MLKKLHYCTAALALCLSTPAFSMLLDTGALEVGDPTFVRPGTAFVTFYDTVEFSVDTVGLYTFDGFYPGDTSLDENLDGFLYLYENSFDPLAPSDFIASDDDGPGGSNTSQILDVSLAAGTSYFMVVTSFSDVPTSFGQPVGDWELSGDGAGAITVGTGPGPAPIPAPATLWLLSAGVVLVGLRRLRKRVS